MKSLARIINSELIIASFVLCIAALLFIPLPAFMLDILIAFNIAFSFLLLLIGLSLNSVLALLAFPTILLLATLFRLSLNVASTRLILSDGYAGEVIQSFGTFLIQGEIPVGIIIFFMLTIINLIVITRGASRVSEVAARFTLDALPGKQLTIDSDLRSGLISAEEARERRDNLRKESQLYGSMDGAMKFVQGDAIVGVFIIFANIFGGIYLGLRDGLSFSEAMSTYTILTIGDGLVTQIPALLISSCAGFVVTRVSSEQNSTLGSDLTKQLLNNRRILFLAAIVTVFLALLPGLPIWPFLLVASVFVYLAYSLRDADRKAKQSNNRSFRQILSNKSSDLKLLDVANNEVTLRLKLAGNLYQLFLSREDFYEEWWGQIQVEYYQLTGLKLPIITFDLQREFNDNTFELLHQDFCFANGQVDPSNRVLLTSPEHLVAFDLKARSQVDLQYSKLSMSLMNYSETSYRLIDAIDIKYFDSLQFIAIQALDFYYDNPKDLISFVTLHAELKEIEGKYPGLFSDLFQSGFINISRLIELNQKLIVSGFYETDLKKILENLSNYVSGEGREMYKNGEFDVNDIELFIRSNNKRKIFTRFINDNRVKCVIVGDEIQSKLKSLAENDYELRKELLKKLENLYDSFAGKNSDQVVLVVPEKIRHRIINLLAKSDHMYTVINFDELYPKLDVEVIGVWT